MWTLAVVWKPETAPLTVSVANTTCGRDAGVVCQANPYHNAWSESFIGTLKTEMLQDGCFINEHDARTELFAFIEGYYNTQRKHSSLGYQTPTQFEANLIALN